MGWSETKRVSVYCDSYTRASNYEHPKGSWFVKGWENSYRWARYYYNDTTSPLKLDSVTVSVAAGHSNGRKFMGSGVIQSPVYGGGFDITTDIYIGDGEGNEFARDLSNGLASVSSINSYNCYYGGLGYTSTTDNNTSFGSPNIFSGDRARHPVTININTQTCPVVQPGQYMFVHVRPCNWRESTGLICLTAADGEFNPVIIPEDTDYIWRFNEDGTWKKERKAFIMTNVGWEEMKEI